jgi:hypothetical protein
VVNAMATVQSIAEVLNHTYIPSVEDKPYLTSRTVTGTRSLLTLSRTHLSGPLSMLVLLEMDKLFGRTSLQRPKNLRRLVFHRNRSLPTSPLPRFEMALGGVQTLRILTTGTNRCASSWSIPRQHLWQMILSSHCSRMLFRMLHTWQAWNQLMT